MIRFNLSKSFHDSLADTHLHFTGEIAQGQIIAIHGPSGAGKTTLLKMLAGLIHPDDGRLDVAGQRWFDSAQGFSLATRKRSLGFVFQNYALFPNMTVKENIAYGQDQNSSPEFTDRIIEITGVGDLLAKIPASLSGGQRQRVAFARAVVRKPKLLLLDEPLSALDIKLRSVLQDELLALRSLLDVTIIFSSHSVPEVFKLADQVMLIDNGRISLAGTPHEVFADGDTSVELVGEFLGSEDSATGKRLKLLVDGRVVSVEIDRAIPK